MFCLSKRKSMNPQVDEKPKDEVHYVLGYPERPLREH